MTTALIRIGRVFELLEVEKLARIKGTPILHVIGVLECLDQENEVSCTVKVSLFVYEREPLIVFDNEKFFFTARAKRQTLKYVKVYLEGWDGVEFDRSSASESDD